MTDFNPVQFPHGTLPEEPSEARLLGIYQQRQSWLFMQRVKVAEGRMTLAQWSGLARLAADFTPEYPLHVTTRQNIELHGIRPEDLPTVQQGIASLGLSGAAACGDSVRNIVVCPRNGYCPNTWDVRELVRAIRTAVESLPWHKNLPRKFKISVSGCPRACGRPWINDVGLVANPDGSFRVILAGSLGAKPLPGLLAYESLPLDDVLPLIVALLRWFHAEGDRANRSRARLRHLRQRFGEDVFLSRIESAFLKEKQKGSWSTPTLRRVETSTRLFDRLCLPLGDITPDMVLELVEAVEAARGEVRLGVSHDLLVFTESKLARTPRLAALRRERLIVTCPGTAWCERGLINSRDAAYRIGPSLPHDCGLLVGITGCPNNCSQAATADIGLIGRFLRSGKGRVEGFRLMAGGGKGETPALSVELHSAIPAEDVHEAVAWLAQKYQRAQSNAAISFADFVATSGDDIRGELVRRYGMEGAKKP